LKEDLTSPDLLDVAECHVHNFVLLETEYEGIKQGNAACKWTQSYAETRAGNRHIGHMAFAGRYHVS